MPGPVKPLDLGCGPGGTRPTHPRHRETPDALYGSTGQSIPGDEAPATAAASEAVEAGEGLLQLSLEGAAGDIGVTALDGPHQSVMGGVSMIRLMGA